MEAGVRMAGQPQEPAGLKLRIANLGRDFDIIPGRSLLETALCAGLNLPHSCRSGHCGSCAARLIRGDCHFPRGTTLGLSDEQRAQGMVLLCQAHARTDLEVDIALPISSADTTIRRLPARIEHCEALSHDVLRVMLRLPIVEDFAFQAGQYLDVILPGGRRRAFSIASAPGSAPLLELHVRRVCGGEFTGPLFDGTLRSRLLNIEGPLGRFHYRDSAAPMLLVGGGTGLAPLDSILRHVIDRRFARRMHLYWGCREARDLYAHERLQGLLEQGMIEHYEPVLSQPDASWRGERGLVHEAVLRRIPDLKDYDVYAAGPPAMIEAIRSGFPDRGARQLYFDSFDYAPDALDRQRSAAASRS